MTITDPTWLEVNGIDLATPAWRITDLSPLLNDGPVRGRDLVIPLTPGARGYRRRRTVRTETFPLDVYGHYDIDGVELEDPVQGVIDHMIYLATNLGIGEDAPNADGTVEAVWHLPDGSTLTTYVHVLGILGTRDIAPGYLRTTIDLSFPSGGFLQVVS